MYKERDFVIVSFISFFFEMNFIDKFVFTSNFIHFDFLLLWLTKIIKMNSVDFSVVLIQLQKL